MTEAKALTALINLAWAAYYCTCPHEAVLINQEVSEIIHACASAGIPCPAYVTITDMQNVNVVYADYNPKEPPVQGPEKNADEFWEEDDISGLFA